MPQLFFIFICLTTAHGMEKSYQNYPPYSQPGPHIEIDISKPLTPFPPDFYFSPRGGYWGNYHPEAMKTPSYSIYYTQDDHRDTNMSEKVEKNHSINPVEEKLKKFSLLSFSFIANHETLPSRIQSQAIFAQALMRYAYRTNTIDDKKAWDYFCQVRQDDAMDSAERKKATYFAALMGYHGRTQEMKDSTIFAIFDKASCDPDLINDPFIPHPKLYKASMWIENRTTALDNITAFQLLEEVSQDPRASGDEKIRATLYKAIMRLDNKTQAIDDLWAMTFLLTIMSSLDDSLSIYKKHACTLHKLFMQKRNARELHPPFIRGDESS